MCLSVFSFSLSLSTMSLLLLLFCGVATAENSALCRDNDGCNERGTCNATFLHGTMKKSLLFFFAFVFVLFVFFARVFCVKRLALFDNPYQREGRAFFLFFIFFFFISYF